MVQPGRRSQCFSPFNPVLRRDRGEAREEEGGGVLARLCAQNNYVEVNLFKLKSAPVLRRQTEI